MGDRHIQWWETPKKETINEKLNYSDKPNHDDKYFEEDVGYI